MKVRELIDALQKMPLDDVVVTNQSDSTDLAEEIDELSTVAKVATGQVYVGSYPARKADI